jgi:hypothetical protein
MDIITGFGPVVPGSSPGGCTALKKTGLAACFLALQAGAMFRLFINAETSRGRTGSAYERSELATCVTYGRTRKGCRNFIQNFIQPDIL